MAHGLQIPTPYPSSPFTVPQCKFALHAIIRTMNSANSLAFAGSGSGRYVHSVGASPVPTRSGPRVKLGYPGISRDNLHSTRISLVIPGYPWIWGQLWQYQLPGGRASSYWTNQVSGTPYQQQVCFLMHLVIPHSSGLPPTLQASSVRAGRLAWCTRRQVRGWLSSPMW